MRPGWRSVAQRIHVPQMALPPSWLLAPPQPLCMRSGTSSSTALTSSFPPERAPGCPTCACASERQPGRIDGFVILSRSTGHPVDALRDALNRASGCHPSQLFACDACSLGLGSGDQTPSPFRDGAQSCECRVGHDNDCTHFREQMLSAVLAVCPFCSTESAVGRLSSEERRW